VAGVYPSGPDPSCAGVHGRTGAARLRLVLRTALLTLLLLAAPALADVVRLKNGRLIEGKVVKRTSSDVHLRTPAGVLVLPLATVASVETAHTAQQELATKLRVNDLDDVAAIDDLALWCSARGLGEQATDLLELSRGIRLERRVAAARAAKSARDFAEAFLWAREQGFDPVVQGWLVGQAEGICRDDPVVAGARATLERDAEARARRQAKKEEVLRRPRYVDPMAPRGMANVGSRAQAVEVAADPSESADLLLERLRRLRAGLPVLEASGR
jgi:hypothetical protein